MCNLSKSHELEKIEEPLTVYKILEVVDEEGSLKSIFQDFKYQLKKKYAIPVKQILFNVYERGEGLYEFSDGFHCIKTLEDAMEEIDDIFYNGDPHCVLCKCTIPKGSRVSFGWWDGGNPRINDGVIATVVSSAVIVNEIVEIKNED